MMIRALRHFMKSSFPMVALALVFSCLPSLAQAAGLCPDITNPANGLAHSIVTCVRNQFEAQISTLITALSAFMAPVVGSMMALATVFFGIQVMGGGAGWAQVLGFMTRLAVIGVYWNGMGEFAGDFLQMPDELIAITSGGIDPWKTIDQFMSKLLGYGGQLTIASGVIGILAGAMFSSAFGFTLFLFGIKAILDLIFLVVQAIFIYLTSFMVIAFMFALSPLIVPLAIFGYTERYVKTWFSIVITSVLTPMFLMICLNIFLPLIPTYVDRIFYDLGVQDSSPNFSVFARSQQPLFSWLTLADAERGGDVNELAASLHPEGDEQSPPAISSTSSPMLRMGANQSVFDVSGLNMGPATVNIMKKLLLDFVSLIIVTYLLRSLIDQMPTIASGIGGGSAAGIFRMQSTAAERMIKQQVANIERKMSGGPK